MAILRTLPASRKLSATGALREPRQAPAADGPALGILRLQRAPRHLLRQRAVGDGRFLAHAAGVVRAALLDDGRLQFRGAAGPDGHQIFPHDHRLCASRRSASSSACGSSGFSSSCRRSGTSICRTATASTGRSQSRSSSRARRLRRWRCSYVLFAKVVPIISIWELKAGDHQGRDLTPPALKSIRSGRLHP